MLGYSRAGVADQGESLRRLVQRARVVAVTSGKGGVGKTNLAVSLAIGAAQAGRRVLLVDADLGLANANLVLGISARYNLYHVIAGEVDVTEAIIPAPGGISVLPGASGIAHMADLSEAERGRLLRTLARLEHRADLIVFDTGAGIAQNVMAFVAAADSAVVVATPEPTAKMDAYATIKTVVTRGGEFGRLGIVVNMAASMVEGRLVADQIRRVGRDNLGVDVEDLGAVVADPRVGAAVRARRPFLLAYPDAAASSCARAVTRRVLAQFGDTGVGTVARVAAPVLPRGDATRACPRPPERSPERLPERPRGFVARLAAMLMRGV